jgi:hypothetical protein
MTIYIPWGIIAIFISLYIFYEYNGVQKAKHNERRRERNERRQGLLDKTLKSGTKKSDTSNK